MRGTSPKTLTVYKASAGSGKTFRLAVEYIKLLLNNPKAYEGTLAVTFTNKATEEMKTRILSQLYGIWKRLPDSVAYIKEVTESLGISEEAAAERAERALRLLLHNYHFFRVQTIDTFFQGILRNLAKELQLNANLRVGLNTKQVVDEAVDEMIDSLAEDRTMRRMVMEYVEDNLAEDRTWNVIGQIKKFGGTIFNELYKQNRQRMNEAFSDKNFFGNYKSEMHAIIAQTDAKYRKIGNDALTLIGNEDLAVEDFSYGATGAAGYFVKLAKGLFHDDKFLTARMTKGMEDSAVWVAKKNKRAEEIMAFVENRLHPIMRETEERRMEDVRLYKSAKATLRHINDVRLLRKIESTAHNLNNAAQRFMLNDTQSLLHEIMEDGDTPFVFEKIGSRLEHIMIDEFQDTSTVQWANFKPLLAECMSHGNSNLIVGDVKQSIYRFRNGDWRLLNDIDREFDGGTIEFPPIRTNRRSERNIINFNNTFFSILAGIEAQDVAEYSEEKAQSLRKAYADVAQEIPEGREAVGLVHIEMLPTEMLDQMEERTLQNILDLLEKGIAQKDIAILVRNKKDIPTLALYIENNSGGMVKMVSAEAFRLDASAAVRIIANAMTLLTHPNDKIALASLVTDYCSRITDNAEALKTAFLKENDMRDWLPDGFRDRQETLLAMSLHDMAEELMRVFHIGSNTGESAYVTAFFDKLTAFCSERTPILEDFIKAWNDEIAASTIETADCDGVRIMTIHKSKGLEFKHVILPYCNWNGNPPHSTIWAEPKKEPFSRLPMVPLDYYTVKSLENTIYEEDGYEEYIQNVVDNLNLLYVAMTRAGHSLFIIGERNNESFKRSKAICETIEQLPAAIEGTELYIDGTENEEEILSVTYGRIRIKEERKRTSDNVFTPEIKPHRVAMHSYRNNVKFKQSNESRRFADDSYDDNDRQRMIRLGTVMHQLFATIHTVDDIEPTLRRMEFDGTLYGEGITHETLTASLKEKFRNAQVADWYSGRWTVYNEYTIISSDGSEHRPDRVITDGKETIVIDFKFGSQAGKHKEQVREYINMLRQMGMPGVKGFIWYVTQDQVVPV